MLHIGAPPGLEHLAAAAQISHSSKGVFQCGTNFAEEVGVSSSHIEKSGENSPMKIRVGSFLRASEKLDSWRSLPDAKMDLGVQPLRPGLQSAAYSVHNTCGWFSDTSAVAAASRANHRRLLPPIDSNDGKEHAKVESETGVERFTMPSATHHQLDAMKAIVHDPSRGIKNLMTRLALDRENVRFMDILPHVSAVAQCQDGSKFLQEYIPNAFREGAPQFALDAFLPNLIELSMQQHGHGVILSLLEVSTAEQKRVLVEKLANQVVQLSRDSHGCRVIQRVVQVVPTDCAERLIEDLKDDIVQSIKNMHANHVIQVCIQELPAASVAFLIDAIEMWGADVAASHIYGCRVVMRILERVPRSSLQRVLKQIIQMTPKLAQDRYGNYVLQHIFDQGCLCDRKSLISEVLKHGALDLALQKYAHNVMEKCVRLTMSPEHGRTLQAESASLTQELLWGDGLAPVLKLALSRFGSKVLLCFFNHLTIRERDKVKCFLVESKERWQDLPHAKLLLDELYLKSWRSFFHQI